MKLIKINNLIWNHLKKLIKLAKNKKMIPKFPKEVYILLFILINKYAAYIYIYRGIQIE